MEYRANMSKKIYIIAIFILAAASLFVLSACEKKDNGTETTQKKIMNGTVESAADFTHIGVYIDVNKNDSGVTDVKYTISGEIAIVSFRYKGVRVELRGSCKYSQYELAGVKDTSNGDLIATDINGYRASLYTLDPGRIIFWSDGKINYSLYIYVTATDDDVNNIVKQISFESRYEERDDVKNQTVDEGKQFAEKIIKVFCDKDIEALEDMMYYPQELGNGNSVANVNELRNLSKDDMFTDILIKALSDKNALDEMRISDDCTEYTIGTNYKNVHFKLMDDGQFLITKINN